MRTYSAALLLIVLACPAHHASESKAPPPGDSSLPRPTAAPDSTPARSPQPTDILRALYEKLTAIGEDRAAVRSRLGDPALTRTAAEPNVYNATATDTLVEWAFDHLHFKFLVTAGSDLLVETRATPDYPGVALLIVQFNTLEAAEASLGAPGWTDVLGDTMVYGYRIPEPDIGVSQNAVNLYFKDGHLVLVAAVPYVD